MEVMKNSGYVVIGGNKYITFLRDWEGGTSSRRSDYASRYHSGIHTVRGITWHTFEDLRPTLSYQDFLNMNDDLWYAIYNDYYTKGRWPVVLLDDLCVKYPVIGYQLLETCWMGGNGGSESCWARFMRKYFGYGPENITPKMICEFFLNNTSNYDEMIKMMFHWKAAWYRERKQPANLNGWMNRLRSLYWYFAPKNVCADLGITSGERVIPGL